MLKRQCIALLLTCLLTAFHVYGYQVIAGDQTSGNSFSFPLKAQVYNRVAGLFFVGANQPPSGSGIDYSIALAGPDVSAFSPLTASPLATINDVEKQGNPLRGAQIDFLSLLGAKPVAIKNGEPSSIYILEDYNPNRYRLLKATNILDANGAQVTSVAALATNNADFENVVLQKGMATFAAVGPNAGVFGESGGGIAVAALAEIKENDTTKLSFNYLATTELTETTPAVYISNPLAQVRQYVALHSVNSSQHAVPLLYIGLQVTSGVAGGAEGVIVMPALAQKPVFYKLVDDSVVGADAIIATNTASKQVNIFHVGTMLTTMQLPYLVVVGGVDVASVVNKKVFALPQLSASGGLAKKDAIPQMTFATQYPFFIQNRAFVTPPATSADLFSSNAIPENIPAIVGGGDAPGEVTGLFVSGDAVFVSVAVSNNNQPTPGIFHSQALFDEYGRIKGWTSWQRVGATNMPIQRFAFDERSGNFWYLPGTNVYALNDVYRSQWSQAGTGIAGLVNNIFASVVGGVQGVFDLPYNTPAFDGTIALTMTTGYQQVLIAQTGVTTSVGGHKTPATDFVNGYVSKDGTLQGFASGVSWISCSGGVLDELGAIISGAVVTDGIYGWFVVAGNGGVAVLAHDDGTGWPVNLQENFVGLDANMKWRKVGAYSNVRKLLSQTTPVNRLYVLTNTTFDRLEPSATTFAGSAQAVTLAQPDGLPGGKNSWFADALVSQKLAILTTSSGMLRSANGVDVTAASSEQMSWTQVPLNDSVGPVTRLFPITVTGASDALASAPTGGNVYVLNAYVGYHQARVYRFTANDNGTVGDSTLVQLPDYLVQGQKTFFMNIGEYRNYMTTDGSIFAVSRSRYIDTPLFEELLGPTWQRVSMNVNASRLMVNNALRVVTTKSKSIGQMVRSRGLGSWLVPGDFGLFVNE